MKATNKNESVSLPGVVTGEDLRVDVRGGKRLALIEV